MRVGESFIRMICEKLLKSWGNFVCFLLVFSSHIFRITKKYGENRKIYIITEMKKQYIVTFSIRIFRSRSCTYIKLSFRDRYNKVKMLKIYVAVFVVTILLLHVRFANLYWLWCGFFGFKGFYFHIYRLYHENRLVLY